MRTYKSQTIKKKKWKKKRRSPRPIKRNKSRLKKRPSNPNRIASLKNRK